MELKYTFRCIRKYGWPVGFDSAKKHKKNNFAALNHMGVKFSSCRAAEFNPNLAHLN